MKRGFAVIALGLACIGTPAWADSACDDVPVKAKQVSWAGEDMVVNGLKMRAAVMTFSEPVSAVREAFLAYWRARNASMRAADDGKTLTLSAIDGQCSYTLQVLSNAQADYAGIFSVAHLDPEAARTPRVLQPSNYPLPEGRVVFDMQSQDGGNVARTVQLALTAVSARQAMGRYAQTLRQRGWRTLAAGASSYRRANPQGYALAMQKDGYRLDASFTDATGKTMVIVNVAFTNG